jgi:hypothetical protein
MNRAKQVLVEYDSGEIETFPSISSLARRMGITHNAVVFWLTGNPRYRGYRQHGIKAISSIPEEEADEEADGGISKH